MIEALKGLDKTLFLKINGGHSAFLDTVMWQLSKDWPTILMVISFAFLFYKKFQLKNLLALFLGIALLLACTDMSTNLVKHSVKRYRPTHNIELKEKVHIVNNYRGGTYGFYSSHAANVFGLITFLLLSAKWLNRKKALWFYLYGALVGYSRIYLGVHYPSDIFVGALDGLLFGCLIFYIINKYFYKLKQLEA